MNPAIVVIIGQEKATTWSTVRYCMNGVLIPLAYTVDKSNLACVLYETEFLRFME